MLSGKKSKVKLESNSIRLFLTIFHFYTCSSIRIGNFLRIYPSARAAVIFYVFLLHIWVAFVLFYYEPEIHGEDDFMTSNMPHGKVLMPRDVRNQLNDA